MPHHMAGRLSLSHTKSLSSFPFHSRCVHAKKSTETTRCKLQRIRSPLCSSLFPNINSRISKMPDTYTIPIPHLQFPNGNAAPYREPPITFLCGHIDHKGKAYIPFDPSPTPTTQISDDSIPEVLPGLVPPAPSSKDNAPVPCKFCVKSKLWGYDWRRRSWVKKDTERKPGCE